MIAAMVLLLAQAATAAVPVSGVVRDGSGLVVPDAMVVVRAVSGGERRGASGPDGRFAVPAPGQGDLVLVVRAPGFAEARQRLAAGAARQDLEIVLQPATVLETVTVTPARGEGRVGDVPASVSVIGREEIRQSPAAIADDVLRRLPAFSLFRRTSSIAAHPTTQGVSLRGIGPSGVSRTLVLVDGVPVNDPFGGWVYWTRLPLERADRIEVVNGSSSSLYGNYAMGGVINVVTAPATPRTFELKTQYGSLNSPKVDASASHVWGRASLVGDVSAFSTDGYAPVVAVNPAGVAERGLVDERAFVEYRNVNVRLDYDVTDRVRAFAKAGLFREERHNGKHSTIDGTSEANDTTWKAGSAGVTIRLPNDSELDAHVAVDIETLHSNFLAVPATAVPPRSLGRMTLNQTVPTTGVGGMAQWRRTVARRHAVSAGMDWRWVDGESQEDGLDATTGTQVTLRRESGGTQRSLGAFVQDMVTVTPAFLLTVSARVDGWRSYDAHNLETSVPSGVPTANNNPALPGKRDTAFSPRLAALYHVTGRVAVWGDIGAGFRAPTLNELYRQFRVGTTLTLANHQLGPERLLGGELGVTLVPVRNVTWRVTWFDNPIKDPISNVTILVAGSNTTQERQNLGRTRVSGIQTDVEYRLGTAWRFTGGYLFDRARVTENAKNPALVGKTLPQVPGHRGSVQVAYTNPKYVSVSVDVLAVGRQFDEDLNERAVPGLTTPGLPAYGVVSLVVSRAFGPKFEAFVGAQNLFDQQYFVGTNPTLVGSPRLVTGGIRVRVAGR